MPGNDGPLPGRVLHPIHGGAIAGEQRKKKGPEQQNEPLDLPENQQRQPGHGGDCDQQNSPFRQQTAGSFQIIAELFGLSGRREKPENGAGGRPHDNLLSE